ncbi:Hsp20/alpha crystallin family protein [Pararhizobium haloflavum]|uniref:Hsp20/alpha crystallin family protein n=1 Tax=Pararhizobium haloflavum TaxID=2037914 RepID=UPI000C1818C5|nr:Hsp20/alpha crystallin family protein [Pararhizobium haloflavum]
MAETTTKFPIKKEAASPTVQRDWNPFDSLRREVDRLFEDFHPFGWRSGARGSSLSLGLPAAMSDMAINPAFDVAEKEKEYEITAELPGIDQDHVEIRLNNHLLTIRGEKSESKEEKEKDYFLSERRFGSFQRSFQVPEGVDTNGIEASFTKGVLTVRLPKSAEARQAEKTIPVKAA